MRPAGEIRLALLRAAAELVTTDAPWTTQRAMAHKAQVAAKEARRSVDNMRRAGVLERGPDLVVPYRNRPVAQYRLQPGLAVVPAPIEPVALCRVWVG